LVIDATREISANRRGQRRDYLVGAMFIVARIFLGNRRETARRRHSFQRAQGAALAFRSWSNAINTNN
jgi:hypothetical protein